MAFATGTGTANLRSFFDQLRTFAGANGFTNSGTSVGSHVLGDHKIHHISRGGVWWNFEETMQTSLTATAVTFARARMTYSKPSGDPVVFNETTPVGQPKFTGFSTFLSGGPYTGHFFFASNDCIHAVLEISPNVYQHLSFGIMDKFGTWTGGEYLTAAFNPTVETSPLPAHFNYITANSNNRIFGEWEPTTNSSQRPNNKGTNPVEAVGGFTNTVKSFVRYEKSGNNGDDFAPMGYNNTAAGFSQQATMSLPQQVAEDASYMYSTLLLASSNTFNNRAPMYPMYCKMQNNDNVADTRFLAGHVAGCRVLNIKNLTPKEIVNTDWQVFPVVSKNGDWTVGSDTGDLGLAYRRA